MKETLQEMYLLNTEHYLKLGPYEAFLDRGFLYFLVPVDLEMRDIENIDQSAHFMYDYHVKYVALPKKNIQDSIVTEIQDYNFLLLETKAEPKPADKNISLGTELAYFHYVGKLFQREPGRFNRIGMWKKLWENRIDRLEQHWYQILHTHPVERFDLWFIESFPYYLGLAENAIQYLVDTEIDAQPGNFDAGCFTTERFTRYSWGQDYQYKIPTEWIFDHPVRDLSEWVRHEYFFHEESFQQTIYHLMNDYEQVMPLSAFAWRLLYARLLFPVHYFMTVEDYYMRQDDEEKYSHEERLLYMLEDAEDYEDFLRHFFGSIRLSPAQYQIPRVDWL